MALTDAVLIGLIAAMMLFALYEDAIVPRRNGAITLRVTLRRRHKIDSAIFIGLLLILLWQNVAQQGPPRTTMLLMVLSFLTLWLCWIRSPALLMKAEGLFYAGIWIDYRRIQSMRLSEDGILVIQLEQRRLCVAVRHLDDLERIYHTLIEAR
ncbi:DUF986 family protein [Pantoea eucrina]|uniref:UPF0266 membrane protein N4G40_08035 n=1 Tax=Pantoea eucrina TaxID=472693 RepID=A0ABU5LE46_9GAMM|nr:DUF986 family protein [Pantoea eucrina]MDZ7278221.1 DUF986 family protein [Pantoea eucrina]